MMSSTRRKGGSSGQGLVRFNGVQVLTDLRDAWTEDNGVRVRNYRAFLDVLPIDGVPLSWIVVALLDMRRRLRKKKHLGEFTEFGFLIRAELAPALDHPEFDAFLDRLIDAVEARGLAFGGGGNRETFEGFVTGKGRASATEDDRTTIAAFCANDTAVVRHDVGPLVDAWR